MIHKVPFQELGSRYFGEPLYSPPVCSLGSKIHTHYTCKNTFTTILHGEVSSHLNIMDSKSQISSSKSDVDETQECDTFQGQNSFLSLMRAVKLESKLYMHAQSLQSYYLLLKHNGGPATGQQLQTFQFKKEKKKGRKESQVPSNFEIQSARFHQISKT